MNPTPAYLRKTIQLMVGLTILAWATQVLFAPVGYGAELPAAGARRPSAGAVAGGAGRKREVRAGGRAVLRRRDAGAPRRGRR